MTTIKILPSADEILSEAIQAMVAARPSILKHVNLREGVYWHILSGLRGQIVVILDQIIQRIRAARLPFAEKQFLIDYIRSEYADPPESTPTTAIGHVKLDRVASVTRVSGTIKKGTRISRTAVSDGPFPLVAAEYITTTDWFVPLGSSVERIPVTCTRAGSIGNVPQLATGSYPIEYSVGGLFDPDWTVVEVLAGGGSDGLTDDDYRRFAIVASRGEQAPTNDALALGALQNLGVKRMAVFNGLSFGASIVNIADQNWGGSQEWADTVRSYLYKNDYVGSGCKAAVTYIRNQPIYVGAIVYLRNNADLTAVDDIRVNIQASLRDYFDNRRDFYTFKLSGVRAAIARADTRIQVCSFANVFDSQTDNVIPEPSGALGPIALHYQLVDNAVSLLFQPPY